jgi:hypothetical protein
MENLKGLKLAILVEKGFEEAKLIEPRKALDQAGAETGAEGAASGLTLRGHRIQWMHTEQQIRRSYSRDSLCICG